MARRDPPKGGLCLLLFVFCVVLQATAEEQCRSGCNGVTPNIFKYKEGTTYKYAYDGKITILLSSAEGQQTSTAVKATVLLTQQGDCNQILRLQNVQVLGADGKKFGPIPDIEKPVRLNFHDGHIEDIICTEQGDTQNSINIKRAIASFFQANPKHTHETDVFGRCPTDITTNQEGPLFVIHKNKNLNKCAFRETIKQDYWSTAFDLNSEIKSSPILNADYSSKQKLKNGILDSAAVIENYMFVPFSVGKNGAKAVVESKLQLEGTSNDNPSTKAAQPKSLIFENPHPVNTPKSNSAAILNAVKETAKTIDITVGENTAKEFINLIKILRVSNKDDLLSVYNKVHSGAGFPDPKAARKVFLDALLRSLHGDAIEVAIELLKNKELTPTEEKLLYLGFSFVRHATEKSLIAASELLNRPKLPREAYLGIGTLAGHYCKEHSCEKNEGVNKLIKKLTSKLGDGKAANRNEENDMIFALKALRNVNKLSDEVLSKIEGVAQDKKQPNRVRVAALEAYLADPCKDKLRDSALKVLKDIQEDSEVRIRAYLVVAQCPNGKVTTAIKTLLENEPSYQVGGYIVSHIKNIRASANPATEHIKQHLGLVNLPKRFPIDPRKWSYNAEVSYTIDTLGLANSMDSNVIYSQNSWLPRATNFNLTGTVFGHTFNFLEIETRQENLDRLLEHYLGPKGVLRTSSLQDLWNKGVKPTEEFFRSVRNKVEKTLRARRDVSKSEIDAIGKQVEIKTNELNKDLDLDLSIKGFGSELLFLNVNDDIRKWNPNQMVDKILAELNKGLDRLKKFEETVRSNILFLDAELSYPTTLGFPLRLAVEGSSSTQLKTSGSIDVRALMHPGKDIIAKLSLIPSGSIEVAGRLTLDALVVENGLKVASTLHTATGGELSVEVVNSGRGVDVRFGLPVEQQKLITASHEIVFQSRELGAPEINIPLKFAQNKDFSICLDQLSPIIGLSFCGDIYGPNLSGKQVPILPFPLAGDAKVAITIDKEDLSQFHFKEVLHTDRDKIGGEFILETLDKSGKQKVAFEIQTYWTPEKFIRASLILPLSSATTKKASAEGRIINNDKEKSILVKVINDNEELYGKIGVSVEGTEAKATYKPIMEFKAPGQPTQQLPFKVEGQVIAEKNGPNQKYTFDNVKLNIPSGPPVEIKGNLGKESDALFTDLTISQGQNSGTIKGRVQANHKLLKFNTEVTNSINPEFNFNAKGELKKEGEKIENSFQLIHGKDLASKINKINIENKLEHSINAPKNLAIKKFSTQNKLTYPLFKVDAKADFEYVPKKVDYDISLQYNDVKVGSEGDLKYNTKAEGDYNVDLQAWALDNRVELKSSRAVLPNDESKIENSLVISGKRIEINGKLKHHIKAHDLNIGSDLTVKLPTHPNPFQIKNGLIYNPTLLDAHHKVLAGATPLVDFFVKATKGGNVNGDLKVNLKDILVIKGQIKAIKGKGDASLLVDAQTVKKSVKAESQFNVHEPNYNVDLTLYPLYDEDKNKKIVISTKNKITPETIDSKNIVDILNHKFEVNAKGHRSGDYLNGKQGLEVEVTLPNAHYFVGKYNRERSLVKGVFNGNVIASAEHRKNKNSVGRKLAFKGEAKNTNVQEGIVDVAYNWSADDGNGKNVNVDLSVKRHKNGDKHTAEIKNKVTGSILSHPIENVLNAEYQNYAGSYSTKSSYGNKKLLTTKGHYDIKGHGKPITGDYEVELLTDCDYVKTIKASGKGSFKRPESLINDFAEASASNKLFVEDPKQVIINYETEGSYKISSKEGNLHGSIKQGDQPPIKSSLSYNVKDNKNGKNVHSKVDLEFGGGKKLGAELTLTRLAAHEYKIDLAVETPAAAIKKNRLAVHTKRSEDGKKIQSEVELESDSKKWTGSSDLNLSDKTPSIDIQVKCPEGKLSQLVAKVKKHSPVEFAGELKLVNERKNFVLESSVDANFENVENLSVTITAHCPALKIEKVIIEAKNKPDPAGRKIEINAKSGGQNLLQGSAGYTAREELGKYIVEGSGSFKVKEQTQSANFKFSRQNLVQDKNGENGVEISFDASMGNKALDAELKITNKQFRLLNSYCEEKKECAHIEIDSKTNFDELSNFNQVVEISIDLRKLGLSHEFGLKAVTNRKGWVLDHTVDIHFQNPENSKYQYSVYLHPKEAGVSLTTPKRVVALEAKVTLPKNLNLKDGGKTSSEIVFYLDKKNQPGKKASLTSWLSYDPKTSKFTGEAKLNAPGLPRTLKIEGWVEYAALKKVEPFLINAHIEADIFADPKQKIIYTSKTSIETPKADGSWETVMKNTIKSEGLKFLFEIDEGKIYDHKTKIFNYHLDYNHQLGGDVFKSGYKYKQTPQTLNAHMNVGKTVLFDVNSKYQLSKESQVVDTEISGYGVKDLLVHSEVKNWNSFKFSVAKKETPNDKFQASGAMIPGQIADIRYEITKGGAKNDLMHASLKLDEANFLKTDFAVDHKKIQNLVLNPARQAVVEHVRKLRSLTDKNLEAIQKDIKPFGEQAKNAVPNLEPVKNYYGGELKKITEEIAADKTIKELNDFLKKVFGQVAHIVAEYLNTVSDLLEKICQSLKHSFEKTFEIIQKELLPQVRDISNKVFHAVADALDEISEIFFTYVAKLSQILEQFQPQFQMISTAFSEVFQELGRFIAKSYETLREVVKEQFERMYNELKALPLFEQLKANYEDFVKNGLPTNEALLNVLKDLTATIKDAIPIPEVKKIIELISNYIEKKLKRQPVNDVEEIKKIVNAIASTGKKVFDQGFSAAIPENWKNTNVMPLPLELISKLPRLVAVRFSPISYILQEQPVGVADLITSLINKPRNVVLPFPLTALIVQGQNIYTFNGKHITFPGACSYLLARDAVNGNFSIVGTLENGIMTAITLADKQNTITLKKEGQILLNNAAHEIPARKGDLYSWRDYTKIVLGSKAGVQISCGPELIGCIVKVSGFYHGQVKGLLGTGNNEPYTDFTIPNGKIVTSENEFGDSYKMSAGCPATKAVDHNHGPAHPSCKKLFGWESPLRYCYPFVKTEHYQMACEHGLAAGIKNTEEAVAIGYVAACNDHGIPLRLPNEFAQCENGEKKQNVGDVFNVKTPGNAADIVLLVDTDKDNEVLYKDLVQPLVQQLVGDLKAKGVSDIEFHLIAYGGENKWPIHNTVGGKLVFKDKAPVLQFSETPKQEKLVTGNHRLDDLVETIRSVGHDLKLALGQYVDAQSYDEALKYPFRAHAVKSVIVANSHPCEVGRFLPIQIARTLFYRQKEINLNLITPVSDFKIKDSKHAKDVVGFNAEAVFTVGDAKKKSDGSSELHKDLDYSNYCVDFTTHNGGNVFITDNFKNNKKAFIDVAANAIATQLTNSEEILECECKFVDAYRAQNVCNVASSKDKATKA